MRVLRRVFNVCVVLLVCNCVFLWHLPGLPAAVRLPATLLGVALYLALNIRPAKRQPLPRKVNTLGAGCELLLTADICIVLQAALCLLLWLRPVAGFSTGAWAGNLIVSLLALYIVAVNGGVRVFVGSAQLTVTHRVVFIILWWVPVVNAVLFAVLYAVARREYRFIRMGLARNAARRDRQVCATRYPILLVHGIFFRDWKALGYWGRIPAALAANGAAIYYGRQQSASSVEFCAEELRAHILGIIEETGCGKVNIIAHSKGGLDARYAISCLGLAPYVASLTTVNTPHQGCRFAKKALDNVPAGMVSMISKNYDKIFKMLGDDQPDFFSGVSELTDLKCGELNALMPDAPGVLYQSVGSSMKTARSAAFPLNLGHQIVHAVDKAENDGLVAVGSMPWGAFTMVRPAGRRGISHADIIDLTRKDIPGFDVCEFYVGLVQGLKAQGL